MPRAKKTKTKSKSPRFLTRISAWTKNHRLLSFLLLVILILVVYFVGRIAWERYNFYRVERVMDDITQQIQAQYPGTTVEKNRSCSKRSEAFGERLGGCSVSVKILSSRLNQDALIGIIKQNRSVSTRKPPTNTGVDFSQWSQRLYYFGQSKNPICDLNVYADYFMIDCYLSNKSTYWRYFPIEN